MNEEAAPYIFLKSSEEATFLHINSYWFPIREFSLFLIFQRQFTSTPHTFLQILFFGDSLIILQKHIWVKCAGWNFLGRKPWECFMYTELWVLWWVEKLAVAGKEGNLWLSNFPIPNRNPRSLRGTSIALWWPSCLLCHHMGESRECCQGEWVGWFGNCPMHRCPGSSTYLFWELVGKDVFSDILGVPLS